MRLGPSSLLFAAVAASRLWLLVDAEEHKATIERSSITYPLGGTLDITHPITIIWKSSTDGTITLRLLKGPAADPEDLGVIAAFVENTGSFTWHPSMDIKDPLNVGNKYGIQVIDDGTGDHENSSLFDLKAITTPTSADTSTPKAEMEPNPFTTSKASKPTASVTQSSQEGYRSTIVARISSRDTPVASTTHGHGHPPKSTLNLGLIFIAAGCGFAGLVLLIVIAVVWTRLYTDRKNPRFGKSFRERRSDLNADSPVVRHFRRSFDSTSSFGDGGRPSDVFRDPNLEVPHGSNNQHPTPAIYTVASISPPPIIKPPTLPPLAALSPMAPSFAPHQLPVKPYAPKSGLTPEILSPEDLPSLAAFQTSYTPYRPRTYINVARFSSVSDETEIEL